MRIVASTIVILLALCTTGAAEEIRAGGKTLSIDPPAGLCAYDRSNPSDALVMRRVEDQQTGMNAVPLQFGACDELADWRAGRIPVLSRYGQVMLPLTYPGAPGPIPFSRRQYIEAVAPQIPKVNAARMEELKVQMNAKTPDVQLSGLQNLGILDQDENGLYIGMLGVLDADGRRIPMAGVAATTLLDSIPVSVNLYAQIGEGVFDKLLAAQKAYLAGLILRNP
jgi:hypothetical protein